MTTWINPKILNGRFLRELERTVGCRGRIFTAKDAQELYRHHCWQGSPFSSRHIVNPAHWRIHGPNQFTAMTARNSLYRAVMCGILERVERGRYRFI
jgi:hypothetical protein